MGSVPLSALSEFGTVYRARVEPLRPWNFGVGTWIERRARSAPDRPALITADGVRTYASLAERIRRLAFAFRRLGVGHGDRIVWLGENHPAFLEALFAAGRIGAVLAPVNHYLPATSVRLSSPTRTRSSSSSTRRCPKPRSRHRCCTGSRWVARAPGRLTTNC